MIVKELLQKLVKRHFQHLRRHFNFIDNQTLALVTEAEYRYRVVIMFGQRRFVLIRRLLTVLDLNTAIIMVVVVRMQEPDLLAFFILTQLQGTVCHLFNHLVK